MLVLGVIHIVLSSLQPLGSSVRAQTGQGRDSRQSGTGVGGTELEDDNRWQWGGGGREESKDGVRCWVPRGC